MLVSLDKVRSNVFQPKINFRVEELENYDVKNKKLYVLDVDGKYEIVAGELLYQTLKKRGYREIEVEIIDSDISKYVGKIDIDSLPVIEQAIVYNQLMRVSKMTQDKLARALKKSQSSIANKIRLLNLNQEVQDSLNEKAISERHGRSLLALDYDMQTSALKHILKNKLSVRSSEEYIYGLLNRKVQAKKYLTKGFTRNIQIGVNSLNQCLDMIKTLGIEVESEYDETDEKVEIKVIFKK